MNKFFQRFQRVVHSYMNFVRGTKFSLVWAFIIPSSWIMRLWVEIWDFFYRHGLLKILEPSIPVISVGNLTFGGTNKTPFVEMLCRLIEAGGIPPGVVSRGYGGVNPDVRVVEGGKISGLAADRRYVGDEPMLLSARLPGVPVAVSPNRVKGLEELERRGVKLAVADDAFQHRRFARDADIVLIDAACSFGNGLLIPAGTLREPPSALRRAHIAVITKVDQADASELSSLRKKISEFVPENRIFYARLNVADWAVWENGSFRLNAEKPAGLRVMAFSAIGNPDSFVCSLEAEGTIIAGTRHFRDHHSYSESDMESLQAEMKARGADYLTCTEKDIYNLPAAWRSASGASGNFPPLLVPRVVTVMDEPERFNEALLECLRPRLVVASNGYGEDAIGVLMAQKLRRAFPSAEVSAFPLVGRGEPYRSQGFKVIATPSVTPSGGVIKYRLRDLWGDIRAGLFGHIRDQQGDWRDIAGRVRTPVCVGDVYLLLHTLWGQGISPLFVATAKTVYLSGHWRLERFIIRRCCRRTWTRDSDSANQLAASGADAVYAGNPIMDLLGDVPISAAQGHGPFSRPLVMLLPGSRLRAYADVKMLLDAALIMQTQKACDYVMALAPTISLQRLIEACEGWNSGENTGENITLKKGEVEIRLHQGDVPSAANGVHILIGLGGTANQLCAGMGIPVISIDEKGKRVQKKLLEDSELLVEPTPEALAACALKVLTTPELHAMMSRAGRTRMGSPGALDSVVGYVGRELGWSVRCEVYEKLKRPNALPSSGNS
ncbi:MAG: tetraacyldisaccharide 4'-kinase [Synergistaceae bacterium]|nr:tetraacyldisaccharide 4'-kinase [Synergistaceae bacterium]